MSDRTWFLTRALRIQSVFTLLIGVSWVVASTSGRLAGVTWLEYAVGAHTVNADTVMGSGWVVASVVMALSGWFAHGSKHLENVGFYVGLGWPLLAGAIFLVAFLQGVAPDGWITTISYLNFTVPYLVLLLKRDVAEEVSLATGELELPNVRGDPS